MPLSHNAAERNALDKILESRAFARANQLRRLLSYVVEAKLDGRADTLKETVIAVEVFGFPPTFDPQSDPVVRMAMRRLRDRLKQYYEYEGVPDALVISLEPGSYVPRFVSGRSVNPGRVSIAVLPFGTSHDSTADADYGALIRDALLTKLEERQTIRLIGSDSPPSFWSGSELMDVAKRLQVRFLVRGGCSIQDGQIRVCTELFCPETGQSIWSGNHEQDAAHEIWTVGDSIASDLERQALAAEGRPGTAATVEAEGQGIYRSIVQGQYYLNQNNAESIAKGEKCFRSVLEQQPTSAKAWAGLSIAQTMKAMYHLGSSPQIWEEARKAAEKAIRCDASMPTGYLAMGLHLTFGQLRPRAAEEYFDRGLRANSGDNSVRIARAICCLAPLGKLQEAEDELESVLGRDPLNPKALQTMSYILYFQRRYGEACEVAKAALDILPGSPLAYFVMGSCCERLGRQEEAAKHFRKCEELVPIVRILKWPTVVASIHKGRNKWVRPSVLAVAKLLQSSRRAPSAMVADLLIRLGEHEQAIVWIQRAFRERALRALFLPVDPAFDAIRSDPRCAALIAELANSKPPQLARSAATADGG